MKDKHKTKVQLIEELAEMRARIAELEDLQQQKRPVQPDELLIQVGGCRTAFTEVTGGKQAEEALRQAEKRYRNLFENAIEGIFQTTPDGRIVLANPCFVRMYGYSSLEEMISSVSSIENQLYVNPEDRHQIKQLLVKQGKLTAFEVQQKRRDGSVFWVSVAVRALYDESGEISCYEGRIADITERKQAEAGLKRYELLSRNTREIILFISHDGRILEANEAALRAYGYDRETMLSLTINDLRAPETRHKIRDQMEKAFSEGIFFESKHIRKDGRVFPVEISSRGVEIGEERTLLSIIRDITERKQAEKLISRANAMLQTVFDGISDPLLMVEKDFTIRMLNEATCRYFHIASDEAAIGKTCYQLTLGQCAPCDNCAVGSAISERSSTIFERKGLFDPAHCEQVTVYPAEETVSGFSGAIIRISDITESKNLEKHLMRADRLSSLGQLSGGIAHEIRNPLAGINLFVDLLRDEEKFSRTAQELNILGEIKTKIDRINGIIKRILDFSKQSDTTLANLEVSLLIQDTLKLWRSSMSKDEIQLKVFLEEDLPDILGDPIEIQQVLNNLVRNAVEAMTKGGALSITAQKGVLSFNKTRPAVLIKIQDTGSGIPLEQQKNIFNPFFTTKSAGTGLGLAISHRIVTRHGGSLSFESMPDVGTTFCVELQAAPTS